MPGKFTSRMLRSLELAKTAARIGFKELTSKDLQSRVEQAKILTESLSRLRGAALKAGQLMSLDLHDYFPPEAVDILSQLNSQVEQHPEIDLMKTLNLELGAATVRELTDLEMKPFAAASMGQVHRASYRGRRVAIKVQYPGLEESVPGDVQALKNLLNALCFLTDRKMKLDSMFQEIEGVLLQEIDYLREARAMTEFAALFRGHVWTNAPVRAPEALLDLTTERVLIASFEPGLTLNAWIQSQPPLARREAIARTVLELYIREFFFWGKVQTDPNPGNFLVDDERELTLVALDFGATKEYPKEFRAGYVDLLRTIDAGETALITDKLIAFGLIDSRETKEDIELLIELLRLGLRPFQHAGGGFDFTDDSFLRENSRLSRLLIQRLKYSAPPHQLIFLHRKLGGVFAIARKLAVKIDLAIYWQQISELP